MNKARIATALLLLVSTVALAQNSARKDIEKGYAVLMKAFKNKDMKGIMSVGTEDFKMKEPSGKTMTGQQVQEMMKAQLAMVKKITESKISITKFEQKGDTAVVTTKMVLAGELMPMDEKDKKVHKLQSTTTSRDHWVKTKKGWKVKLVEALTDKTTIDGKPMNMGGG